MDVLFDRVAWLDVGKASLTVCVRTPGPRGRRSETRTFKTTTGSLRVMRAARGDRTRDVTRLEQMLEDASIKLSAVGSSLSATNAPGRGWPSAS